MNKYKKNTTDTGNKNKANRTSFTILALSSKQLYTKQAFRQRIRKHTKTLLNNKYEIQNATLESIFNRERNKI